VSGSRVFGSLAVFLWVLLSALPGLAQDVVGSVVSVTGRAELTRDGGRFGLAPEVSILSGDTIQTGSSGTVELRFRDDTRVVVGPGSQFVAADIRMRRSGRASRFAVATAGGTFRFLSGDSARRVYDIRTPTATMGVRGTQFDFALDRRRDTTLVTFDGEVQLCGAGRRCFAVSGSCATVRAGASGVDPTAVEGNAQLALLQQQFPFTQSQERLSGGFRTDLAGCDDRDAANGRTAGTVRPAVVVEVTPAASASEESAPDDDPPESGGDDVPDPRSGG